MSEDSEARAREMGWKPQEEFKGDPANWVDAAEYVRRGEEVLPLVKAENRRLQSETERLSNEIRTLTAAVLEQRQSMNDMAEFNHAQLKEKLAEQRRSITAELRAARKDDDDAAVERLEEALEVNEEARKNLGEPPKKQEGGRPQPRQPVETPEYLAWKGKNPWLDGSSALDVAKTGAAIAFGQAAAKKGLTGKAFFDYVDEQMEEAYPKPKRADPSEDGRPSGSGGGSGSASSQDNGFKGLPADAKAKCREQAAKFVGPNKIFKTAGEWEAYYAKQYYATEAA